MTYRERMKECQELMEGRNIDVAFLSPGANMLYVSGFSGTTHERHLLLIVPADQEPFFFVPELMRKQVDESTCIDPIYTWEDGENPRERLEETVGRENVSFETCLIEETMPFRFTRDIRSLQPKADFRKAGRVFEQLRIRKEEDEIERTKEASRIADEVVDELRKLGSQATGMTEKELADLIKQKLKEKGGEKPSFDPVASSGENGAKPHHRYGEKRIGKGEPVVLDFGCIKDNYRSDQTRTVVFSGDPPDEFKEVHSVVRKAQQEAFEKVEPGVEARKVDRAAREVIEDAGYGDYFNHRTGHGIGLSNHEPPFINQVNERKLERGMVFSIEPGIYIEGEFGVRIEDLVAVTGDGCRRLNHSDKNWKCQDITSD